jgi:flagellar biosynthesis protein FlhA
MPFVPFMLAAAGLGGLSVWAARQPAVPEAPPAVDEPPRARPLGDLLDFDEIHIEFAPNLVAMALDPATGLDARIASMRSHVAQSYGLILPEIRITDEPTLAQDCYRIRLQGVERVRDRLRPDRVLVLLTEGVAAPPGEDVREPVYGAPARWISPERQEDAALSGLTVVTPPEVLATHLLEVVKGNLARLLSLRGLKRLFEEFTNLTDRTRADANRRLLDEIVPDKVPVDVLLAVLRLLLDERVSVRNLPMILEALVEARGLHGAEAMAEHVRQRLGFQLVAELKRDDGTIPLIQLAPEWERTFAAHQIDPGRDVALPPEQFSRLASGIADRLNRAAETGVFPALVASAARRRFLRTVVAARGLTAPVLSYEEIGMEARPALLGQVPA